VLSQRKQAQQPVQYVVQQQQQPLLRVRGCRVPSRRHVRESADRHGWLDPCGGDDAGAERPGCER